MKKTTYHFDELLAKLRKFYETPAPVNPRLRNQAKIDQAVFQHNVKKLSDEDLFLITYVEDEDGNSYRVNMFGNEIMARGFNYQQYREFINSLTIIDAEPVAQRTVAA